MDECIIETLSYFDVFDYPLTYLELKKYSGCPLDINDDEFYDVLLSIPIIQEAHGYYYFLGRSKIVEKRMERKEISIEKIARAKIIVKILSRISTIQYIGISGSLSMDNASVSDDIDLFIVVKNNTLWTTRFLVNAVLILLGQKRDRRGVHVRDKICPNMFMEEKTLSFRGKYRNMYIAHEIVQLRTMFDRGNVHDLLMGKNNWIQNFFPNVVIPKIKKRQSKTLISVLLNPVEKLLFFLQKFYMKGLISREIIKSGMALFHPIDRQGMILETFGNRFEKYREIYMQNLWVDRDDAKFFLDEKKIRILN